MTIKSKALDIEGRLLSYSQGGSPPTAKRCQSSPTRGGRRNPTLPYRRMVDLGWLLTVRTLSKTQRVNFSLRLDVRNSTFSQYPDASPFHKSCELKRSAWVLRGIRFAIGTCTSGEALTRHEGERQPMSGQGWWVRNEHSTGPQFHLGASLKRRFVIPSCRLGRCLFPSMNDQRGIRRAECRSLPLRRIPCRQLLL
jgi:hypothetical protein